MKVQNNVQSLAQQALESANIIFAGCEHGIRVEMLTAADLDWCIALQRQQTAERRLPWDTLGTSL